MVLVHVYIYLHTIILQHGGVNNCHIMQPSHLQFTIHGLWPAKIPSSSSLNCKGDAFNVNGMDDALKKELLSSWWDWKKGKHVEFWQREYDKHGKCSDNVFPKTEYFRKTLAMYHDFDIAQILQKANIVPQPLQPKMSLYKLYSIDQITKAIESETGRHSVNIRCYQQDQKKKNESKSKTLIYLAQVALCYDRSGNNRTNCDPDETTSCNFAKAEPKTVPRIAHIKLW
ncbi:ribonuclease S-7-like [Pyrus ussuriensis x Pyrus communis]|uniref:Ribonuclease S-7-like n=1 Tax=Pyrus ussuriensis x Pyrus communis TaxID=2448454 RepID=A0A5N5GTJ3_9ROSA|nr:ribonuclease S-7-like [Pyrus ussuriensis x Pyrus communis]